MRELRFVMPSDDDTHVVVEANSNVGFERFRLPITDELRAAINSAATTDESPTRRPMPTPQAVVLPHPEPLTPPAAVAAAVFEQAASAISPREIQVRVRAGELPEQIAETFNASLDWVMRFAGPVIDERGRVTDEARRARARRSTADAQTVIFGETVDARFSGHGIDPALVLWDSHRREDGQWVISAHWLGGESDRTAEWAFNLSSRTVIAIDETASDLLSDRPIRPVFTDAPVTLTTSPPLAPGVVAFPAQPNAHTGPLPTREQLFDQHAFREDPLKAVPTIAPAAVTFDAEPLPLPLPLSPEGTSEVVIEPELDFGRDDTEVLDVDDDIDDVDEDLEDEVDEYLTDTIVGIDDDEFTELDELEEPLPTVRLPQVTNLGVAHRDGPADSPSAARQETEDEKAARAHIPSWDDILLGVRRKND